MCKDKNSSDALLPRRPARRVGGKQSHMSQDQGARGAHQGQHHPRHPTLSQRGGGGRGDAAVMNEDGPDVREGHTGWEEVHVTGTDKGVGTGDAIPRGSNRALVGKAATRAHTSELPPTQRCDPRTDVVAKRQPTTRTYHAVRARLGGARLPGGLGVGGGGGALG